MAEGLKASRPKPRIPLHGQPSLDSALVSQQEENQPKKPKPFWVGTVPNVKPIDDNEGPYIKVNGYKISGVTIIEDDKGRKRELDPVTKLSFERDERHGTATPVATEEVNNQYGGGKPKFRR